MDVPEQLGIKEEQEEVLLPTRESYEWRRFFRTHPRLRQTLTVIAISALTVVVMMSITFFIGWNYRDRIAALLIATLPPTTPSSLVGTIPQSQPLSDVVLDESEKELSVTEVVAKVNPSVVSVEVSEGNSLFPRVVSRGTGFFVTANGYIITNRHVVDAENGTFSVTMSSGKKYQATLVAKDPVYDLAVLKVTGSGFPVAELGNSKELVLGQSVVAIGFALGKFENSVSVGVVSGLGRSIVASGGGSSEQLDRVIQTDAAINPGNSGGPLINMKGEVVGVNVAVARSGQNVGFAIPSESVQQVIDSVKAYGFIVRPYVGISYRSVDARVARSIGTSVEYGIVVEAVLADSPAARAGVQSGDIILSVDGTRIDESLSFSTIIRSKRVGQTVSLRILRQEVQQTLKVQLAQAPE